MIQRFTVGWTWRIQHWKRNRAKTESPKKKWISLASFQIQKADCGIIHETRLTFLNTAQIPVSLHYKNSAPNAAYTWVFAEVWLEWKRPQALSFRINTLHGRCKELFCFYNGEPITVWSMIKSCTIYYLLYYVLYICILYTRINANFAMSSAVRQLDLRHKTCERLFSAIHKFGMFFSGKNTVNLKNFRGVK